jgi:1-acyl-sn-glycerol-3-phosphate acyltransferase
MKMIRSFHTVFCWIVIALLYVGITLVLLPLSLFYRPPERIYHRGARFWARMVIFFAFIRLRVKGLENVPRGQGLIIASNHQSLFDIIVLLAAMPDIFFFVAKKELFKVPFLGWYMKKAGYISIDRQVSFKALKTLDLIKQKIKSGQSILIFPEGTRSPDGQLQSFKRGSFAVALETGSPILPVAISNTYKIVPKGHLLFEPQEVFLTIDKPLPVARIEVPSREDCDLVSRQTREIIEKLLSAT